MRRFTWNAGHNQTHHPRAFFDWLFQCSLNLVDYQLIILSSLFNVLPVTVTKYSLQIVSLCIHR
jgi:hypothetical protein